MTREKKENLTRKENFTFYIQFITECIPGYTGLECTLKCPYPLFGKNCQKHCDCPTTKCNFQSGCLNGKNTEKLTISFDKKLINSQCMHKQLF